MQLARWLAFSGADPLAVVPDDANKDTNRSSRAGAYHAYPYSISILHVGNENM